MSANPDENLCLQCEGDGWINLDGEDVDCDECFGTGRSERRHYQVEWRKPVKGDWVLQDGSAFQCGNNFTTAEWVVVKEPCTNGEAAP